MTRRPRSRKAADAGKSRKILLTIGAAVLFAVGLYAGFEIAKPPPPPDFGVPSDNLPSRPQVGEATAPTPMPASYDPPPVAPPPDGQGSLVIDRQPPPANGVRPRISIVIDDLGRSLRDLDTLAALGVPLTYSVLPFETQTPQVVAALRQRGEEYLCHLPMEAKGGNNPGPGALLIGMTQDQLAAATREALAAVPGAAGVNNHMGSGLLSEQDAMTTVLEVVAEHRLYFLDSRTSADTVGYSLARHLGLPAGERQVFLDTKRDREFIRGQFATLLRTAEQRGGATAIGHPYPETLEILAQEVPAAREKGFEFVTASALIEN